MHTKTIVTSCFNKKIISYFKWTALWMSNTKLIVIMKSMGESFKNKKLVIWVWYFRIENTHLTQQHKLVFAYTFHTNPLWKFIVYIVHGIQNKKLVIYIIWEKPLTQTIKSIFAYIGFHVIVLSTTGYIHCMVSIHRWNIFNELLYFSFHFTKKYKLNEKEAHPLRLVRIFHWPWCED